MDIGFIGLGAMGMGIVPRLMAAGHTVTGWNRSRGKAEALIAAGMKWGDTPKAVADRVPRAAGPLTRQACTSRRKAKETITASWWPRE